MQLPMDKIDRVRNEECPQCGTMSTVTARGEYWCSHCGWHETDDDRCRFSVLSNVMDQILNMTSDPD